MGEVNTYASAYNGKTNELIRVLADSGDFETNFISNKQDACQNLYRKILDRNVDSGKQERVKLITLRARNVKLT